MFSNVLFLHFVCSQKTVPFTFFYSSICRICTQFWTLSRPLSFVLIEISFLFRDFGRPNDSFLYFCAHSIFPLKCLCFLYELLGIFHEVPGDVKFLNLKARTLSMSPGKIQYMLLQSGLSKITAMKSESATRWWNGCKNGRANFCEH